MCAFSFLFISCVISWVSDFESDFMSERAREGGRFEEKKNAKETQKVGGAR